MIVTRAAKNAAHFMRQKPPLQNNISPNLLKQENTFRQLDIAFKKALKFRLIHCLTTFTRQHAKGGIIQLQFYAF